MPATAENLPLGHPYVVNLCDRCEQLTGYYHDKAAGVRKALRHFLTRSNARRVSKRPSGIAPNVLVDFSS